MAKKELHFRQAGISVVTGMLKEQVSVFVPRLLQFKRISFELSSQKGQLLISSMNAVELILALDYLK